MVLNRKTFWAMCIIYAAGIFFVYKMPNNLAGEELGQYFVLLLSYYYVPTVFFFTISKNGYDIFEPITLYSVVYFLLYTVTPLVLFIQDNLLCCGIYVMDGCIKGTCIYMASYTIFCLFYMNGTKYGDYRQLDDLAMGGDTEKRSILRCAWIIWIIAFAINIYYLLSSGRSISYILSFGFLGEQNDSSTTNALFLTDIGYMIIGSWIYIWFYEKKKAFAIISFILSIAVFYIRGFRFIVIIMLIAVITSYYLSRRKKPTLKAGIGFLLILFFIIAFMGFVRNDLRTGMGSTFENFNFAEQLSYSLYSNFNIYQTYYGIVADVPTRCGFKGFATIWENIYMWIPRAIWPGKPATGQTYLSVIADCLDYGKIIGAAMATPDLSGYYYSFGVLGCVFYSAFWGTVCRKARRLYTNNNVHDLILYSLFMPTLFQMIIRGSDLTGFIKIFGFICAPPLIMKFITKRGRESERTE